MTNEELSPEALKALETVQKLLNLGKNNSSDAEAAAATAKAQAILEKYNLDIALLERTSSNKNSKREKAQEAGGFYKWQQEIWGDVAALNFCKHWVRSYYKEINVQSKGWDGTVYHHTRHSLRHSHCIVGRTVNVVATRNMARYLEQTINRILLEKLGNNNQMLSGWANSFRIGAAHRICEKLKVKRQDRLNAEAREREEAEARARQEGRPTEGMGNALTLSSYVQSEEDANYDFLHGEGAAAKLRADRARWAEERRQEQEAYTRWAAAHPEEAAAKEKEARERYKKESEKRAQSYYNNVDTSAYWAGYDTGDTISIEPQVDNGVAGLLQ